MTHKDFICSFSHQRQGGMSLERFVQLKTGNMLFNKKMLVCPECACPTKASHCEGNKNSMHMHRNVRKAIWMKKKKIVGSCRQEITVGP
jgi:hypothetical protein